VKEYELYLPVTYNDGSPVEEKLIDKVGELLLDEFDGVTFFPQKNEGSWRMGHAVFRDRIVIFRVLAEDTRKARRFFKRLKVKLKVDLDQEEILIVEKQANSL